jgi:excisionase family DNA binding protein
METFTFEQLPQAVSLLHEKINRIEQLLLEKQNPQNADEMLDISQAAAFLNLTVSTVYCKVSSREIPVNKRGRRLYFYKSELEAWVKGGRKKTVAEIQQEAQGYVHRKSLSGRR